ncbi:hypothetical protein CEUSTIGMA_g11611.t1 [Chlamydomonas eustigma]|uniref:Beta-adaptin appendage C-terminal subdomain domain-containing protein n=1 Tax=Chlamydomonas eustigma TaxID=1157962 RepID=A0A250XM92_9CHLO|nr:hypothetical protein CEUSTIGMA_g11611.t1 [Chlamydomonas eustigma]|eukprot:GAX84188.1 hypothetical protein CEUSTIGMA_g11611.t1 [Chlamydomonas eustigma]
MVSSAQKPRGEVADLQTTLQSLVTLGKRTPQELRIAKRDAFKKIVSLVSMGMDMSSLFPTMISCANLSPDDLILKKMLYLYITHYATQIPDLALLAINQLHKDCCDQDPTVRGLALRSLCSLRVPNFLEYVSAPVNSGLTDRHPYVRRTAVMGVLKIYHIDPAEVLMQGLLEKVHQMQRVEADPQVLANCLTVLMQIEGVKTLASDKSLIYNLINKIKDFSDWSQCQVLELVSHYVPSSESEVYDFLNALEDRMSHANSAVALSTIKTFLHLTLDMTATHQQVLERIREPLKTLISREDPSTTFAILSHVLILLQRAPMVFETEYQSFYCRTHDPWYIKKLKMECLTAIATSSNVYDIVGELTEYARDINPSMARQAVKAVGRIALTVPDVSGIIERLLLFLDAGSEALTAEALVQMKDLLRRYPDIAQVCLPQLSELSITNLPQPEARAAFVWIMGQFGHHLQAAPYVLESLVEGVAIEHPSVRLALLTAGAQLFFKRPPECKALLGSLLATCLNDAHQDVHDRALLYYRLLRSHVAEAERIINPPLLEVQRFSEVMTEEMRDMIFKEFNSLSVIFQAPSSTFVEKRAYHLTGEEEVAVIATVPVETPDLLGDVDQSTNLLGSESVDQPEGDLLDLDVSSASTSSQAVRGSQQPVHASSTSSAGGLLDLGSLLGGDGGASTLAGSGWGQQQHTGWGAGSGSGMPSTNTSTIQAGGVASAAANLLDLSDLLGGGGGGGSTNPSRQHDVSAGVAAVPSQAQYTSSTAYHQPTAQNQAETGAVTLELRLNPKARVTSAQFQDQWKALPPVHQYEERLSSATLAALAANAHKDFAQHMEQAYIMTMASGGQPPTYKYYMYGQVSSTGSLILVEMVVNIGTRVAAITIKTEAIELLFQFIELWGACFMGFSR